MIRNLSITADMLGDDPRAEIQAGIDSFFRFDVWPSTNWPFVRRIVLDTVRVVEL